MFTSYHRKSSHTQPWPRICGRRWAKSTGGNRAACPGRTAIGPGASLDLLLQPLLLRLTLEALGLGALPSVRQRAGHDLLAPLQGPLLQSLSLLKMALLQLLKPLPVIQPALLTWRQPAEPPAVRLLIPPEPYRFLLLLPLQGGPRKDRLWLRNLRRSG